VKCYIGIIFVCLRIILCVLIYTNKHFWRCYQKNGCWVNFKSSSTLYHYTFIFSFYHGSRIYPYLPIWCTHERTPTTIRVFKAYPNTWLQVAPTFNIHGSGLTIFGQRWWKPLFPPKWVWANMCMPTHSRHSDETLRWKLFPFSLTGKAKCWYNLTIRSKQGDWEALCSSFCLQFFPISRVVRLRLEILPLK
jgi:hypothetical protein